MPGARPSGVRGRASRGGIFCLKMGWVNNGKQGQGRNSSRARLFRQRQQQVHRHPFHARAWKPRAFDRRRFHPGQTPGKSRDPQRTSWFSRIRRRENSSCRIRRMRVFGNVLAAVPVILTVTPHFSFSAGNSARLPIMSGLPCLANASSSVSTQNAASMVIDSRQDSTRRLNQSSTTAR